MFGVPESITHDGGSPYNSGDWKDYAKEQGFESRLCTPEHPEGNGIAERFMAVLVKTIHAAKAEKKDPKVEVKRRLLNYRNTPHPATGKAPAELMFRRSVKTRIPSRIQLFGKEQLKEAKSQESRRGEPSEKKREL